MICRLPSSSQKGILCPRCGLRGQAFGRMRRRKEFSPHALSRASITARSPHPPWSLEQSQSCGKPLADSVAAGLLTLGPRHGNAASAASQWLRDAIARNESAESIVTKSLTDKRRIPGIGHPEYDIDPRAVKLVEIAKSQLTATPHCDLANDVSRVFSERKGKPLPLNVDGAIGALIADLGAPADLADAIFIAARTVGLIAHAREEAEQSESYRR